MSCEHDWVYQDGVFQTSSLLPHPLDMLFGKVTKKGIKVVCIKCAETKVVWKSQDTKDVQSVPKEKEE